MTLKFYKLCVEFIKRLKTGARHFGRSEVCIESYRQHQRYVPGC